MNRYNFTWWDTTTFLPYVEETSFEGSLLVQKSGTLTLSSLKNIFQSLTTNARGIFNIIIKHHLDNKKDAHYQGLCEIFTSLNLFILEMRCSGILTLHLASTKMCFPIFELYTKLKIPEKQRPIFITVLKIVYVSI